MTTTTTIDDLVRDFDDVTASKAQDRNRSVRSAQVRKDSARALSSLARLAVGAGAAAVVLSLFLAFCL